MANETLTLAAIYAGWEADHQRLTSLIRSLTQEQLALRAAPHLRTVSALASHIVAARARMTHWILREGDDELNALAYWDGADQPAPPVVRRATELADGLETTWQVISASLQRWTAADLANVIEWTYHGETSVFTRGQVIWNLVRHDYHHGGEIMLTLGVHGIATPEL
ncbi:MAG TPA: DinB family protein [Ktedonobacterales bacterium]|jgi:uncharacterized damage-inducible protein DinB|nr:DinB family protein [Ktedonobacterales bacterium]